MYKKAKLRDKNFISSEFATTSEFCTREQAAAYAGVSVDTIDDLRKKGCIQWGKKNAAKCGKVWILKKSLKDYIMGCFQGGNRI